MKKIIAQIITVVFVLAVLAGNVSAASFGASFTANVSSVKPGSVVEVTFGLKDIDIQDGINSVEGKLEYDKNIFEEVTDEDITQLNGWATSYNSEATELNGKFLSMKLSSGITKPESVFKIKLKVKEGVSDQNTTITISNISTAGEGDMIETKDESVLVKISKDAGNNNPGGDDNNPDDDKKPGEDDKNPGDNNPGGDKDDNNNPDKDKPGSNNKPDGSNNPGGSNNNGNTNNTGKDNTGYQSGKLPQTGTNANMLIAIGIVIAIGVGSLIKYEKMK